MRTKQERLKKIKRVLRSLPDQATISQVHEIMTIQGDKISRKTIERDMFELVEEKIISQIEGNPIKFQLLENYEVEVVLTIQDLTELIEFIPVAHRLHGKLGRFLSF
jgi:hypothetical protein